MPLLGRPSPSALVAPQAIGEFVDYSAVVVKLFRVHLDALPCDAQCTRAHRRKRSAPRECNYSGCLKVTDLE